MASFIDDIIGFGKDLIFGGGIGSSLARTALLGLLANKLADNTTKENTASNSSIVTTPEIDRGVRLQVNPDANHKIPVVYGSAYLGGIITDAQISNSNTTMHYVSTICEQTGSIDLGEGVPSTFTFEDIYLDDQRCVFSDDGITVAYTVDRDGNLDYSAANLIKVYCYAGDSDSPVVPDGYSNVNLSAAYDIMPLWTVNHTMVDLIFAIVEVNYNKEKGITKLPTVTFHMTNSMTQPGDCLYDYMTNTRYGAGIDYLEIYAQ